MYLEDIKNIYYSDLYDALIQFMVISDHSHPIPYAYCCTAYELYADWMGDCNFVPENDAMLLSATIYIKDKAYPIAGIGLSDLATFEVLMEEISKVLH